MRSASLLSDPPAGPVADGPRRWRRSGYWLWPALAAFAITIAGIGRAPLWRDELATWSAASRDPADLLRMIAGIDAVAGPYYLLVHGWIQLFGDSAVALRLPAALAMTGAAGLTAVLGNSLFDPPTGLLAGLLFAVVPSTSRYGQEARPYALATLLAVLATLLLVRALRQPGWQRWLGYAAAVTGLGLAHLVAVSLVAGHAVAVGLAWWRRRDRRLLRWLGALAPVVILLAPLALVGRTQQGRQLDWVGRPSLLALPDLPGAVVQAGPVGGLLIGLAALGALNAGSALNAGGIRKPDDRSPRVDRILLLAAAVLLPAVLLFAGGLVSPLWVPRYLVFVVPFGCLLAATVLRPIGLTRAIPVVVLAALLGAPQQAALRRTHEWPRDRPVDYPAAARIIAANQRPGDGIVYSPRADWAFLDTAVAYHLRADQPRDVLLARDAVRRGDLYGTECDRPALCLAGVDRIWVLTRGEREDPLNGMTPAKASALRADYQLVRVWPVPGLTVALLHR